MVRGDQCLGRIALGDFFFQDPQTAGLHSVDSLLEQRKAGWHKLGEYANTGGNFSSCAKNRPRTDKTDKTLFLSVLSVLLGALLRYRDGELMSAYVPVPAKLIFCGLPPPLSPIETLAVRDPLAKGVNVTVIKQLSPAGTLLPQVLVSAKSLLSIPTIEIPVKFTATLPLLLSVILLERLLVLTG